MIKKILLTLLIFGISIIGYSNAVFPEPIMSGSVSNGYSYSVYEMDIPGQFNDAFYNNRQGYVYNDVDGLLNIENNQILIKGNTSDNRFFTFGWINGNLYGIANASSSIYGQGYLRICEGTYSDNGYFNNCMFSNNNILINNYNVNIDDIDKNITFDKLIFIPYSNIYNRVQGIGNYCFASSTSNYVFCILYSIDNGNSGFTGVNNLISQIKQGTGAKYDIFDDSSPFLGGGGGGSDEIPENGFPNTNRGVFDAYAEQGYVLSRCYSDFALDNLATATGGIDQFYETELDDGVYYTGATVLDLFVEYGYGNSFESFFDYWYQTYNQSLINDSPAKYVGLSKGLWNMSNKYYYAGLSNKYVDYTKFYKYCSYFVDFDGDWGSEYTGPQLPDDVANLLAPSKSAIDYLSGFIHSQNSVNNQNFDANTFFTSLTTKFDRLLNNINGSFIGIIPGYILAIMMALIFIRIISH